jgi:hypothetical protein
MLCISIPNTNKIGRAIVADFCIVTAINCLQLNGRLKTAKYPSLRPGPIGRFGTPRAAGGGPAPRSVLQVPELNEPAPLPGDGPARIAQWERAPGGANALRTDRP